MNRYDEYHLKVIHDEAEKLRAKVIGGILYGMPIDMNNADMVLLAIYWLASTPKELIHTVEIEEIGP